MPNFTAIEPSDLADNVFRLIGSEWMLITAGDRESFNTMTASWGGLGVLWHRPVSYIVVRPVRHTYRFLERGDAYTLSFFDARYKSVLQLCGSKSGRDIDKVKEAGISPRTTELGSVYFEEARLVLECRKIYFQDIDPRNFVDQSIGENYPDRDYHRMYVGQIVTCLKRSE
ncbi:MAG TPA: flavin reductase [Spirochaetota bacterium]|nr:flavin reductase [Spirochaetota bacterium]